MSDMDGLWTITYATPDDGVEIGSGVLYVKDGDLWGGDTGYYWFGKLTSLKAGVSGQLDLTRFNDRNESIFGIDDRKFSLWFEGSDPSAEVVIVGGEVTGRPELKFTATLRRVMDD